MCRGHASVDTKQQDLLSLGHAAFRLLQDEADFRDGVNRGIAAAERGEFVEHEEVWANVEKILQP